MLLQLNGHMDKLGHVIFASKYKTIRCLRYSEAETTVTIAIIALYMVVCMYLILFLVENYRDLK